MTWTPITDAINPHGRKVLYGHRNEHGWQIATQPYWGATHYLELSEALSAGPAEPRP